MKHGLIFLVCLAGVGLAVAKFRGVVEFGRRYPSTPVVEAGPTPRDEPLRVTPAIENPPTECLTADDISTAFQKFSSENEEKISEAQTLLLRKAGESQGCRGQVIAALMTAMDRPDLDFTHNKDDYYLWRYGAELLGELKASEALDLLISHLAWRRGLYFSTSMNHLPALRELLKMGPIAIPKLDAVLRNSPDPELRFYALYGIATIGGTSAVSSLEKALESESDACLRRGIRASLDSFDESGNIKNRMEWFSGLLCDPQD